MFETIEDAAAGWYPVASTQEVGTAPTLLTRFGTRLVAWRGPQGVVIGLDACPHRGASLALGHVRDGRLVCPFHAFAFDATGACMHMPDVAAPAPGLRLRTFPCAEAGGMVWMWAGRGAPHGLPGLFEWLPADARTTLVAEDWEAPLQLVVENQLDHLHLHAVHPDTVGRGVAPTAPVKVAPEEDRVRVWFSDSTDDRSGFAEYRFPSLWGTKVSTTLAMTIGFAPISATRTRLYLQGHRGFARAPGLAAVVDQGIRRFHRKVLSQDRPIVESQVHAPRAADRLFRSDAAIRWFRERLTHAVQTPTSEDIAAAGASRAHT
jgi:phenylpropionate dioxygenase-like ring-hydroxylating dioxygenase large terminal subunit